MVRFSGVLMSDVVDNSDPPIRAGFQPLLGASGRHNYPLRSHAYLLAYPPRAPNRHLATHVLLLGSADQARWQGDRQQLLYWPLPTRQPYCHRWRPLPIALGLPPATTGTWLR